MNLKGNRERLKATYHAEQVRYGNDYQLYNVCDELRLADNRVDNRLSWSNWTDKTYCGGTVGFCFVHSGREKWILC